MTRGPDQPPPGRAGLEGDQPDRPTTRSVAEVVGVARVAPEATVHHLVLVLGILLEVLELGVGERLAERSRAMTTAAPSKARTPECVRRAIGGRELDRDRDDPGDQCLHDEDREEAAPDERVRVLLAHRRRSGGPRRRGAAAMWRASRIPQIETRTAISILRAPRPSPAAKQPQAIADEDEAPGDVGDRGVAHRDADDPGDQHHREGRTESRQLDREVEHRRPV